jgi:hypothetical protein
VCRPACASCVLLFETQHVDGDTEGAVVAYHQRVSLTQRATLRQYLHFLVLVTLENCAVTACHERVSLCEAPHVSAFVLL